MTSSHADEWDLVVVGAGPAGAATALGALAADPGLRVLLVDREDFPRDKSCGDGIAPHVVDVLREVGVDGLTDGWAPLRTLRLIRGADKVARLMARPAWVIPREVFDARLVERATRAGAVLVRHRVRDVRCTADGVLLDGRFRGAVVVGADGAHSVVATTTDRSAGRRALAIRGYAPTTVDLRGEQRIVFGRRRQPAYAWAFDRGDGLSNVGYGELLGGRGRTPSRTVLLEQLDDLLPGAAAAATQWRAHHLPLSGRRFDQPDGPLLLAGDAAGLVNPLTGEGIYYAVATGVVAGRAAARAVRSRNPAAAGALHRASVRRLLARHWWHTAATSRLLLAPAVVAAGLRASARDQRVFDDVVELGLGRGTLTPRMARGMLTALASRSTAPHPSATQ